MSLASKLCERFNERKKVNIKDLRVGSAIPAVLKVAMRKLFMVESKGKESFM